ncbi:ChuX/HutX family heme-like substrate-binding protein [Labrenzia sp. CE80]|uniref:ChuX/HutX family heme-like substrate-binding protein n=1 Tax=Labrenzia sp. CE80 TaxID=1788986 RepID=UPI00129B4C35|nr:ChuX/HutX family heme-like substrate-binding protein [Labrenzia sp. CE80]
MNKIFKGTDVGTRLVVDNTSASRKQSAGSTHCEIADLYLSAGNRARGLSGGVDLLRNWLPSFERVIASTANACAVMADIGIYQVPMCVGEDLTFDNTGIATRLLTTSIETLVAVEADVSSKEPPSLQAFDAAGRAVHKCHIASLSDQLAFDVLMYGAREKDLAMSLPGPFFGFVSEALKPAGKLPAQSFCEQDVKDTLDNCLRYEGKSRHDRLKKMDRSEAWTIDRQVIPHVLRYFCELRMPMMIGVPSSACMQLKSGRLDDFRQHGDLLELDAEACRVYLDPAAISEYWVVRNRNGLSLECYSKSGACVLVFAHNRLPESRFNQTWTEVMQSLPRCGAAQQAHHGER